MGRGYQIKKTDKKQAARAACFLYPSKLAYRCMNRLLVVVIIVVSFVLAMAGAFCLGKALYRHAFPAVTGIVQELSVVRHGSSVHQTIPADPNLFNSFYNSATSSERITEEVYSAVIPHHLVAGEAVAAFFKSLERPRTQEPPVVVLIGPNHSQRGGWALATSEGAWQTPDGILPVNLPIVKTLESLGLAIADEKLIDAEHSIGAVVPFIKHTWPHAELVPLILKENTPTSTLQAVAKLLKAELPPNSFVLASVDFSHYLPLAPADFHDELAANILATGNLDRLSDIEIDSPASLRFLLTYNKLSSIEAFRQVSHTNSARLLGNSEITETTSHIIGYFSPGQPEKSPLITLQFFGDIMLDRNVAKAMGNQGLDYIFAKLKGAENRFFTGTDLMIANLEGPFAPSRVPTSKTIAFRFDPKYAAALKDNGFDVVSLANNHTLDMGFANVDFTMKTLDEADLSHFGHELKETDEYLLIKSIPGINEKVAFIGINTTDHPTDMTALKSTVEKAKAETDTVIAFMHWGHEYQRHSHATQQELAHTLIDWGVTAVIGAHPHVVQEVELYKDRPIFYSLGNFIFDQYFSKDTQEGLSVGLTIQAGKVKTMYAFPLQSNKSQVQLMVGKRRIDFIEWLNTNSTLDAKKFNQDGYIDL